MSEVDDGHFPLSLKPNVSMRNSMLKSNQLYLKFALKNDHMSLSKFNTLSPSKKFVNDVGLNEISSSANKKDHASPENFFTASEGLNRPSCAVIHSNQSESNHTQTNQL